MVKTSENPERLKSPARSNRKEDLIFDYKDAKALGRYINSYGQIESRRKNGLSAKQQRQLAKAIKRARHIALLPYLNP